VRPQVFGGEKPYSVNPPSTAMHWPVM
jgi:hypothetical protein